MVAYWFRRDLRLKDNHALFSALSESAQVLPVFIFDDAILSKLPKADRRVDFIHRRLSELDAYLRAKGYGGILVLYGDVEKCWKDIDEAYDLEGVYCNRDYEPNAIDRDFRVEEILREKGAYLKSFKDQVIFEESDILKSDGTPYTIYTPYKKQWLKHFDESLAEGYPSEKSLKNLSGKQVPEIPSLEALGFESTDLIEPPMEINEGFIKDYDEVRNFPP